MGEPRSDSNQLVYCTGSVKKKESWLRL